MPLSEVATLSVPRSHANGVMAALLSLYGSEAEAIYVSAGRAVGDNRITSEMRKHRAEFAVIEELAERFDALLATEASDLTITGAGWVLDVAARSSLGVVVEELGDMCGSPTETDFKGMFDRLFSVEVALNMLAQLHRSK